MEDIFFTVFTPIYNRKHTIYRVWDSLIAQTNKNFEWLIVNDGSNDNIEPLLEEYKDKADFKVRIFHQQNSGKHIAFNKAIENAKGELFIPADSDDSFSSETIEVFTEIWKKYKNDSISGISVLCKSENDVIVGDNFTIEGVSNLIDITYKYNVKGEKWGCIRLDVLKKFKFPTDFDVKFFPEAYLWTQIGLNYKTVFVNVPLRTYYQDAGNQLTNEKISQSLMKMYNFYTLWRINYLFPYIRQYVSIKDYLRTFVYLWMTTLQGRIPVLSVIKKLEKTSHKILAVVLLLPVFFIFLTKQI